MSDVLFTVGVMIGTMVLVTAVTAGVILALDAISEWTERCADRTEDDENE